MCLWWLWQAVATDWAFHAVLVITCAFDHQTGKQDTHKKRNEAQTYSYGKVQYNRNVRPNFGRKCIGVRPNFGRKCIGIIFKHFPSGHIYRQLSNNLHFDKSKYLLPSYCTLIGNWQLYEVKGKKSIEILKIINSHMF